jgi:hypothetical protein
MMLASPARNLMRLEVHELSHEDVWKDIVRIPHAFRRDVNEKPIRRGEIVRLTVNGKHKFVVVLGCPKKGAAIILVDSKLRTDLKLKTGMPYTFDLRRASLPGQWVWMWTTSDPSFRVPAQVSLVSFGLGMLGLILGIVSARADVAKFLHWVHPH